MTLRSLTAGSAARKTPNANLVLAIGSLGVFMTVLDLFIVNVAFPNIERDFAGSSLSTLAWILNGYAIIYAAMLVPAGRIADRVGQKRVFVLGLSLFTIASALCSVATGPEFLIVTRLIQAIGAAAVTPTSLSLLLTAMPPEKRTWAIGIWTSIGGMGGALGPIIGGLLVSASWRWVFLVNLPIGIVAVAAAIFILQEHRNDVSGKRPDLFGALLLTAGIAALSLGIVQGPEWGWGSPKVMGSFLVALVAIAGFIYRSAHHAAPIVEPDLVKVRSFAVPTISALLLNAAFSVMLLGLVQYLTGVWGYSALRTGLAISPGPLMVPLFASRSPKLIKRFGAARVAIVGATLFGAAGLSWYFRTGLERDYLTEILPGLIAVGFGFAITLPALMATATRSLPPKRFATGSAAVTMARQIGSVLGVSLLVVLLDSAGSDRIGALHHGWLLMSGFAFAAGAMVLFLHGVAPQPMPVARRDAAVAAGD